MLRSVNNNYYNQANHDMSKQTCEYQIQKTFEYICIEEMKNIKLLNIS